MSDDYKAAAEAWKAAAFREKELLVLANADADAARQAAQLIAEKWGRQATMLAASVADLLDTMEMQEKRESGAFHITGEVAFGIWSDAKKRASDTLKACGFAPPTDGA